VCPHGKAQNPRGDAMGVKVADWAKTPRANIIFVHGLGGHAYDTWRRAPDYNSFWPLWLAEDVEGISVWTLAYDAPASNWMGTAMPLQDRVGNVRARLLATPSLQDAPITFICHSLGGLIVKQLLLDLHQQKDRSPESTALLDRVTQVVFMATVGCGSWRDRRRSRIHWRHRR
jgi:triacylglycerol esterase/lipase EstA (alpha/beta hydrolase family)